MRRITLALVLAFCAGFCANGAIAHAKYEPIELPHKWQLPTWGNTTLGDCTYAAVANYETIALHIHVNEQDVINSYLSKYAPEEGVPVQNAIEDYANGVIGGTKIIVHEIPNTQISIEHELDNKHYIIMDMFVHTGEFGSTKLFRHFSLLSGWTESGPEMISWGFTYPMTWAQFEQDSIALYVPEMKVRYIG